ncbi:MAG: ribonuclease HII [Cyanobium sp. PLM2.Bin73]|nr:MAG: ribonuclease HII [Cyanobium sp. PLM2.Bin73]
MEIDPWLGRDPQQCAGVDEVGRGCLFGPVFAAAVVLPAAAVAPLLALGLGDSKALTARRRAALVPEIRQRACAWALGQATAAEIDRLGIRAATERAMVRALHKLPAAPELLIVDGVLPLRGWQGPQATLVRGDQRCPTIAAASVLAKQARDQLLRELAGRYPAYGLERHVGYGTAQHRQALLERGPTPLHRRSFLGRLVGLTAGGTSAGSPPPTADPPGP